MSERPQVSVGPRDRRKRQRLLARLALAAALFLWPAILQIEKLTHRAESLKVLGQAEAGGPAAGHRGTGQPHHAGYRRGGPAAPTPSYGALREALADVLEAQLPPVMTLADARAPDLVRQLLLDATAPSRGGPDLSFPLSRPSTPDTGVIFGPAGPGGGPPVTNPPVVDPGGPNPPVIDPPVVDPGTPPPVVTPPDGHPPVVPPPPPPVTNPNPPVEGPGGGTFTPPGDPGGGGPSGGNPPIPPVPEPAVWLQLVVGAGLAGAALRRARARWGRAKIA